MSKVRIGFVGVGSMGQGAHLRNYATLEDCEVVALAEVKAQLGAKVAQRYGIPKVYTSHTQMLAEEKLDGIVASQPFTRHGTLLPELVAAGLPIFIEKPLAGSIQMAERILASLQGSKASIMVGYHKRSDPATRFAKAEVDRLKQTQELGKLTYVRILMPAGDWVASGFTQNIGSSDPKPSLQFDPPAADMDKATNDAYIAFVNYYIHQVNLMRHLLGESYKVSYADPSGVVLVGHSDSGVACTIEMTPYRTTVDWQESALVAFEKGYVKLELPAPLAFNRPGRVEVLRDPGDGATPETRTPQLPWIHAMRQQAMNFLAVIQGKAKPPCDAREAMEDLKVAREYIRLRLGK